MLSPPFASLHASHHKHKLPKNPTTRYRGSSFSRSVRQLDHAAQAECRSQPSSSGSFAARRTVAVPAASLVAPPQTSTAMASRRLLQHEKNIDRQMARRRRERQAPPSLTLTAPAPFNGSNEAPTLYERAPYELRDDTRAPQLIGAVLRAPQPPPQPQTAAPPSSPKTSPHGSPRRDKPLISPTRRPAALFPPPPSHLRGAAQLEYVTERAVGLRTSSAQRGRLVNEKTRSAMREGSLSGIIAFSNSVHSTISPRMAVLSPRKPMPSQMPRALIDELSRRHDDAAEFKSELSDDAALAAALSQATAALQSRGIEIKYAISPRSTHHPLVEAGAQPLPHAAAHAAGPPGTAAHAVAPAAAPPPVEPARSREPPVPLVRAEGQGGSGRFRVTPVLA